MVKIKCALISTIGPLFAPGNIHGNVQKCLTVWNLSVHEEKMETSCSNRLSFKWKLSWCNHAECNFCFTLFYSLLMYLKVFVLLLQIILAVKTFIIS